MHVKIKKILFHTDKTENKIFLIYMYKEIQMGSGAKSYMRKGFLFTRKCTNIFTMRRSLVIYCMTLHPIPQISFYMRKI